MKCEDGKMIKYFLNFKKLNLTLILISFLTLLSINSVGQQSHNLQEINQSQAITPDQPIDNKNPVYLRFEHRIIIAYLLQSTGLSDDKKNTLAHKMENTLNELTKRGVELVEVNSMAEYYKQIKGEWPSTHQLALDLNIIEKKIESQPDYRIKMFYSRDPSLQLKIVSSNLESINYFASLVYKYKIPLVKSLAEFSLKSIHSLADSKVMIPKKMFDFLNQSLNYFNNITNNGFDFESMKMAGNSLIQNLNRTFFIQLFSASEALLNNFMQETEPLIKEVLEKLKGVGLNPGEMRVLEILFKGYFKELSPRAKKLMLNALLELPANSTTFEKFELMIKLADPFFQKSLQLFANAENMSPEMKKIFKTLESSGRPVPWVIAKEIIGKEVERYGLINVSEEPLGVGTQRQYHQAEILRDGKIIKVVVGFIKPDVPLSAEEGGRIMEKLAPLVDNDPIVREFGIPLLKPLIHDSMRLIKQEEKSSFVRNMQTKFYNVYNKVDIESFKEFGMNLKFLVPKIYYPNDGSDLERSELIVQDYVEGDKIDEAIEKNHLTIPNLKKKLVESLIKLWIEEMIFGSGLYHGDLHHGNIKLFVIGKIMQLPIMDYGMVGQVSVKGRSQFMKLGASIELLDANLMTDIFLNLTAEEAPILERDVLLSAIQNKIKNDGRNVSREVDDWIKFVMSIGVSLRSEVKDMMRGYITIKLLKNEVSSDINFAEVAKEMSLKHPIKSATLLGFGSINTPRPNLIEMAGLLSNNSVLLKSEKAKNPFWSTSLTYLLRTHVNELKENTLTDPSDAQLFTQLESKSTNKKFNNEKNNSNLTGQCRSIFLAR